VHYIVRLSAPLMGGEWIFQSQLLRTEFD